MFVSGTATYEKDELARLQFLVTKYQTIVPCRSCEGLKSVQEGRCNVCSGFTNCENCTAPPLCSVCCQPTCDLCFYESDDDSVVSKMCYRCIYDSPLCCFICVWINDGLCDKAFLCKRDHVNPFRKAKPFDHTVFHTNEVAAKKGKEIVKRLIYQ